MEFLINEVLELLPLIGLAGTWSMNKPSQFSPFKKQPRQEGEEVFNPASRYGQTETVLGANIETPTGEGTGIATRNTGSGLGSTIDTSSIDFGDEDQVKEIQRAIGVTDDGQWGPNTEKAYQQYINERRGAQGLGQYMYDDLPTSKNDNNIGTLSDKYNATVNGSGSNSGETVGSTNLSTDGLATNPIDGGINDTNAIDYDKGSVLDESTKKDDNKFWGPDKLWNWMGYE